MIIFIILENERSSFSLKNFKRKFNLIWQHEYLSLLKIPVYPIPNIFINIFILLLIIHHHISLLSEFSNSIKHRIKSINSAKLG